MGAGITRREFIDGIACAVAAGGLVPEVGRAAPDGTPYPPARTGYLGSRPQDFAIAHGVRDGRRYEIGSQPVAEQYDIVVIGSGIGGLASAHYLRKARPGA
ncbi:MAG: twin-arginine translocation signal domain-containing protein, partial [Gammaproteobacteria bacterium]|nr:twin-arginine translocation signal domain-containing protein [Gammaproteobacteria bacterium]